VLERRACEVDAGRHNLVDDRQPRLRIDQRGVARKRRRIQVPDDCWNIERLVRRRIPVRRGIHRRQEDERCERANLRQPVASIAMCVQPCAVSHSANSRSSRVVVGTVQWS
jgi:hypothetical protein